MTAFRFVLQTHAMRSAWSVSSAILVAPVLLALSCGGGGDDEGLKLTDLSREEVEDTCDELERQFLADKEVVDGVCKLWAADHSFQQVSMGTGAVVRMIDLSACTAALAACPRESIRGVCINPFEPSHCAGTLEDLMDCDERLRAKYRSHANESCKETTDSLILSRSAISDPNRKPTTCERAWTCFPQRLFTSSVDGGVPICPE